MPLLFIMTGEAVALIGAHTIGKVRVEFGPGEAGPWVPGGDDAATSNGPSECLLFDFALWFTTRGTFYSDQNILAGNLLSYTLLFRILQSLTTNITIG